MTYEEAKKKGIEILKTEIRNRLHKYNPSKYSKPRMYSATEVLEVAVALNFTFEKVQAIFEVDSAFYKHIKK